MIRTSFAFGPGKKEHLKRLFPNAEIIEIPSPGKFMEGWRV